MSIIKQIVIARFCEGSESGVSYMLTGADMKEYYLDSPDYKYVCDIEFEDLNRDEIVGMGVAALDKEIISLQVQITNKEAKKKQLLAIEHVAQEII